MWVFLAPVSAGGFLTSGSPGQSLRCILTSGRVGASLRRELAVFTPYSFGLFHPVIAPGAVLVLGECQAWFHPPCAPNHSKAEAQPPPCRQLPARGVPGSPVPGGETGGSRELSFPQPDEGAAGWQGASVQMERCVLYVLQVCKFWNAGGIKTCLFGNQWWIAGAKSARSSHGFSLPFFHSHRIGLKREFLGRFLRRETQGCYFRRPGIFWVIWGFFL